MSLWSKVKGGLDIAQVCIEGIELIDQLIKAPGSKPENATDALKLIANVIDRVKAVLDDKMTPDSVRGEFAAMTKAIRQGNETVAQHIDDLFPKGD